MCNDHVDPANLVKVPDTPQGRAAAMRNDLEREAAHGLTRKARAAMPAVTHGGDTRIECGKDVKQLTHDRATNGDVVSAWNVGVQEDRIALKLVEGEWNFRPTRKVIQQVRHNLVGVFDRLLVELDELGVTGQVNECEDHRAGAG
jgi:hypothetical protein